METHRNIQKTRVKNYLNNVVDIDVQSMLLPLNLMQYIMFCPKYRIINDCITPNSFISNVISIIVTLVFILLLVICFLNSIYFYKRVYASTFGYMSSYFDIFFYSFGLTINCVLGIIQSRKSTKFVICIQNVHRFIKNESILKHLIIWNWIIVVVVLCTNVCACIFIGTMNSIPFSSYYACFVLMIFDFNFIYAIRLIKLLENMVLLWSTKSGDINSLRESDCEKAFQAYVDILDCYTIFKDCFQLFVSTF